LPELDADAEGEHRDERAEIVARFADRRGARLLAERRRERLRARKELVAAKEPRSGRSNRCSPSWRSMGQDLLKIQLIEALRREEGERGLTFEYCLMIVGAASTPACSNLVEL
jgi:hypothetical protein